MCAPAGVLPGSEREIRTDVAFRRSGKDTSGTPRAVARSSWSGHHFETNGDNAMKFWISCIVLAATGIANADLVQLTPRPDSALSLTRINEASQFADGATIALADSMVQSKGDFVFYSAMVLSPLTFEPNKGSGSTGGGGGSGGGGAAAGGG